MKLSNTKFLAIFQKFYPLLLFLAIVWLCWSLARAFWLVISPPVAPDVSPVAMQVQSTQSVMGNGLDIFARAMPTSQPTMPPPDVKIVGLTSASPEHFSFAMLNFNGKVKSYKINEMLEGSPFKLASVKSDHIILADSNGQTSRVEFNKPFSLDQRGQNGQNQATTSISSEGNTLTLTNQVTAPPPHAMPTPQDFGNPQQNPDFGANQGSDNQATPSGLDTAIAGLQENPAHYLTQMGVASSGNGYVVTDAMPTGIKDRLGLQTGDKVISVNGQTVGQNPSQDASLLEQVKQSGQAQIQVQRGEQVITLNQSF